MRNFWKRHGSSLVLAGGMAAIALGVWMIYPPAGLIAAGVLMIAWWVLDTLGGGDEP